MNMKIDLAFHIRAFIMLLLLSSLFFLIIPEDECRTTLEFIYIFSNLYILYVVKRFYGTLANTLVLFLFSIFIFNGIRLLLDIVGYDDIRYLYSPFTSETITQNNNNRAILNVVISTICLSLGYFCLNKRINEPESQKKKIPNPFLFLLFIIGFVCKIYVAYKSFTFIMLLSYKEVFTDGIAISGVVRGISYLPVFICLLKLRERKKKWIFPMIIWALLHMASGQRGPGLLLLIFTFYYCFRLRMMSLNITKILIGAFFAVILSIAVGQIRVGDNSFEKDFSIMDFLWEEGSSLIVLQVSVEHADKLDYHFGDLFANVASSFYHYFPNLKEKKESKDYMVNQVVDYKYWSAYISYKMDPTMYFSGGGMGGNYIGQSYAVGKEFFVIISSFLVGLFLCYLEIKLFSTNHIISFLAFSALQSVIYLPRDNLTDFIMDLVPPIIMLSEFYIFYFFYSILGITSRNQNI